MELEIRHLRCFLAIVDNGGINRAARSLGLPASAVTQQLQRIERHLGLRLFERGPAGMALTDAGRDMVRPARQAVDALRRVEYATTRRSWHLRLASEYLSVRFGREENPSDPFTVELVDVSVEKAVRRVADGDLDVVQGFDMPAAPLHFPPGLTVATVARERLAVMIGPAHRLWERSSVSLAELADDVWVSQAAPHRFTTNLRLICQRAGFEPRIRYATGDRVLAGELTSGGGVVALASPLTPPAQTLRSVPLVEDYRARIFVAWRRHAFPAEVTSRLVDGPREWYGAMARRFRPDDWHEYAEVATEEPEEVAALS